MSEKHNSTQNTTKNEEEIMESWKNVWREGVAPLLSQEAL